MRNLNEIGIKFKTDKNSLHHGFLDVYESYLKEFKNSNIALIELGVGGYEYVDRGGESMRMWYEYFPYAKLICLDLHNKHGIMNDRTDFFQGSQTDKHLLKTMLNRADWYQKRIVIDDASHINTLTIESFNIIFPLLKRGDLYFVEDAHTSYWKEHFNGNPEPGQGITTMNYFTNLCHQLNFEHFDAEYRNEFADLLEFVHFYKELIVIKRK